MPELLKIQKAYYKKFLWFFWCILVAAITMTISHFMFKKFTLNVPIWLFYMSPATMVPFLIVMKRRMKIREKRLEEKKKTERVNNKAIPRNNCQHK